MSSGLEFPGEAVLRHADAVAETSDEIALARAAAGEIIMDSQAYGQLCQFLPAMLSPLFGLATEVMSEAVDALGETALKLRATASDMTTADANAAGRVNAAAGTGLDLPL